MEKSESTLKFIYNTCRTTKNEFREFHLDHGRLKCTKFTTWYSVYDVVVLDIMRLHVENIKDVNTVVVSTLTLLAQKISENVSTALRPMTEIRTKTGCFAQIIVPHTRVAENGRCLAIIGHNSRCEQKKN